MTYASSFFDPSSPSWYQAVFAKQDSEQQQLAATLETLTPSLQVVRLVTRTHRLVIAMPQEGSHPPSQEIVQMLHAIFGQRQHVTLPSDLLALLQAESGPTRDTSDPQPQERGILYRGTSPHLVTFRGAIEPHAGNALHGTQEQEVSSPIQATSPFALVDRLREQSAVSVFAAVIPMFLPETRLVFQSLIDEADHYLFTASAHQMHAAIMDYENERQAMTESEADALLLHQASEALSSLFRGTRSLLLVFEHAQVTPSGKVTGIFLHPCAPLVHIAEHARAQGAESASRWSDLSQLLTRFTGLWNLDILGEDAIPVLRCGYDSKEHTWILTDHMLRQQLEWIHWLTIAYNMIRKRYARTPEAPSFPEQIHTARHQELVPRRKGKGKPKLKWVERSLHYTTITYDVSVHTDAHDDSRESRGEVGVYTDNAVNKRHNWLSQANPEDLIFEQRDIDPYTRRYPLRRDGTRREGAVTVTHKEPRWIVLLRPGKHKTHVRKKVTAQQSPAQESTMRSVNVEDTIQQGENDHARSSKENRGNPGH